MDASRSYLAGLFDGEGSIHQAKTGPKRIVISNTSKDIINAAYQACKDLDIEARVYKKYRQNVKWKQCYEITIYSYKNLARFDRLVPFRCSEKRAKLDKMLKSYTRKTMKTKEFEWTPVGVI